MEHLIERLCTRVEAYGRETVDPDHSRSADAVGGQELSGFKVSCMPSVSGSGLGAPASPWADPYRHQRIAAGRRGETPSTLPPPGCGTQPPRGWGTPNQVLQTALTLLRADLSVIPIGPNKRPAIPSWKCYQSRLPTPEEWIAWVASRRCGLAIVLGGVSSNAEVIDFDDLSVVRPWYDLVEAIAPGLIARLVIVETPTGGRHVYYRCATIQGNQRLALTAQRQVMIETRGEGGYALIPPSPPGCHPDHKPYVLRQGDLAQIPTITADEREILLTCARSLTQYVEPERVYTPRPETVPTGERPGDLFAAHVSWEAILLPHGWRTVGHRGAVTLWCRPGKKGGLSATTGYCGDHLYVFSSNALPFEPERAYSKFTAFALLNAGGDFIKAATILARQGYVKAHEGQTAAIYQRYEGFPGFNGYRVSRGYQGAKGAVSHEPC